MDDLARLKWQCRRGTKELDFLLNRYMQTGYLLADIAEKSLFAELLSLQDDFLIETLIGDFDAGRMEYLVAKIRKSGL